MAMKTETRADGDGAGFNCVAGKAIIPENTIAHSDFQELGGAAGAVVASLSCRREKWIARRCRVAPAVAHAVASVVFPEVTQ